MPRFPLHVRDRLSHELQQAAGFGNGDGDNLTTPSSQRAARASAEQPNDDDQDQDGVLDEMATAAESGGHFSAKQVEEIKRRAVELAQSRIDAGELGNGVVYGEDVLRRLLAKTSQIAAPDQLAQALASWIIAAIRSRNLGSHQQEIVDHTMAHARLLAAQQHGDIAMSSYSDGSALALSSSSRHQASAARQQRAMAAASAKMRCCPRR